MALPLPGPGMRDVVDRRLTRPRVAAGEGMLDMVWLERVVSGDHYGGGVIEWSA